MRSILDLYFRTGLGRTFRISLDNPREDIIPLEVENVMNLILDNDIFDVAGGLTEILRAQIISTETKLIEFD